MVSYIRLFHHFFVFLVDATKNYNGLKYTVNSFKIIGYNFFYFLSILLILLEKKSLVSHTRLQDETAK